MPRSYWDGVRATGLAVPADRPLDDLTVELTGMLGSPDPEVRDGIAYPMLATWIGRGVYDDLLAGLGDGMASGLAVGLGETDGDSVFRRSFSALVLGECLGRDNDQRLLPPEKVWEWGDRVATWLLRERDLRAWVPGRGWAHAVAHGADALGLLAGSPHVGASELGVVLDVIADRVLIHGAPLLSHGEPDRLAAASLVVLRRDLVPLSSLEAWVDRLAVAAGDRARNGGPVPHAGNAEALLRAPYLHLGLAPHPAAVRADLLLVVVEALRRLHPELRPARG